MKTNGFSQEETLYPGLWPESEPCSIEIMPIKTNPTEGWENIAQQVILHDFENIWKKCHDLVTIDSLQQDISSLKNRIGQLEQNSISEITIQSLTPEPYHLLKPLQAIIRFHEEQFIGSIVDANLSASGDTLIEAISNLKDIIVGTFEILSEMKDSKLGPGPLRQKKFLEEFIQKKN